MITRVTILTAIVSLSGLVVGCGDNSGDADFEIDDVSESGTIAGDFEGIDVIVADACAAAAAPQGAVRGDDLAAEPGLDAPITSRELVRDSDLDGSGTRVDVEQLDPVAAPSFCDIDSVGIGPEALGDNGALAAADSVCACDYPGCVADAISDSFGCGVCVTFGCGDFDVSDCVPCEVTR